VIRLRSRLTLVTAGLALLYGTVLWPAPVIAQPDVGAICVVTYADTNGNGLREDTEIALPRVNVNLSTDGVIIATHITAGDETQYCFENLLPGIYTITFTDSPTYRTTTSNQGTFALESGQRLTLDEFGAVPIAPAALRAEVAAQVAAESDEEPLDTSLRLLLATVASMVVMIFMVGVGAVLVGLFGGKRRPASALAPPAQIAPPDNWPR
jgi:hypothetical protein